MIILDTQLPRHSVSVAGVITDDHGRALLIQRRDNHRWEPPGGVLELAESIHDGLRREVREETGLDVEPITLTGVYKNLTRGIVALVFRCKVSGGHLTTNDEVAAFQWASKSEVERMMTEAYAVRVLDALRLDPAATVRTHDGVHVLTAEMHEYRLRTEGESRAMKYEYPSRLSVQELRNEFDAYLEYRRTGGKDRPVDEQTINAAGAISGSSWPGWRPGGLVGPTSIGSSQTNTHPRLQ